MSAASILLVGAGGHSRACIDVIEQEQRFAIGGLIGLPEEVGARILGHAVIGTEADLPALLRIHRHALVTVGQIQSPDLRIRLFELLERSGCELPAVVSPRAYLSRHATVGAGSIVMHGAVVNAGAVVGKNCIINSQALVEHDAIVGDHCHISTASALNGGVRVGAGTFIGSGSRVRQNITIGERCLIGMGQQVFADCAPGARVPASRRAS